MILKDFTCLFYKPSIFYIYNNSLYIELSYRLSLINNNNNLFYYKSIIFLYIRLMKTHKYI